ncbi:anthranilate synthase component I [Candidatus Nitrosacidococcus sp. I8]|uniref:anthranilate synthase component I n=1 Tax=Candidatus Nitrosacidococcus sp. I8 TaxID=2942908 RepID=UPI002226E55C|nr:anthranilate synthase component I [Candidatus Nitrosacidococcus sp. I8]CAH9019074.1 Anthranilate synthase component 1 [Candidatus Nitrosacidococcus sp. I8]
MDVPSFEHLVSQGYNYIPLVREVLADLDTPLSIYLKLAQGPYSYLLESMHGNEKWSRYSFIGLPCRTVIKVQHHGITVETNRKIVETYDTHDPLTWIENFKLRFKVPEISGLPRFTGGLVGYFGYDTIRYIEPKLAYWNKSNTLETPDIFLLLSEELVIFDNLSNKLYLIVYVDPENYSQGVQRLSVLENALYKPLLDNYLPQSDSSTSTPISEHNFISEFTETKFKEAVTKARQYIIDGDMMQVVLSQRLSVNFRAPPLNLYRSLRYLNPSPYMYYFNFDEFYVVGSSPEILVRIEEGKVSVRPIAGTRRRGKDESEDLALEQELMADPKELAEHQMLIDLGRNDIGRIAEVGSIKVTEKMAIERYSHVMHIVSNVIGQIKTDFSTMDVIRATFPAGTVSGAPKIRAMEVIDELEPTKRGIYAGAVGYLAWSDNMDMAIAIRTGVIKNNTLYIQAGAGIVYDSIPQYEWNETMNKGRAMFQAAILADQSNKH